jgi:hypothetical protein
VLHVDTHATVNGEAFPDAMIRFPAVLQKGALQIAEAAVSAGSSAHLRVAYLTGKWADHSTVRQRISIDGKGSIQVTGCKKSLLLSRCCILRLGRSKDIGVVVCGSETGFDRSDFA